jgi:uncharacterized membrane protein
MLEAYAFLTAFGVQILVTSVLYPAWFSRYVRMRSARLPAERLAQLYPGVDLGPARERFLARYRALNTGLAVLGVLLLVWLFGYLRRPDWHDGPVEVLVTVYFLAAQMLPLGFVVWRGIRFNKEHKRALPEGKRRAVLQRRGLFDFVSKFVVCLAALGYFLFAAFVIFMQGRPSANLAGLINLGGVTLVYALTGFVVYTVLYGKNRNSLETHASRMHTIGIAVKSSVYSCIVIVMYLSLNFSLRLLDLQKWEPLAVSVFFVICSLLASMGVIARQHRPELDELGSGQAL